MWAFLGEVLQQFGLAAVVMIAVIGGAGFAIYHQWKQNNALHEARKKDAEEYAKEIAKLNELRVKEADEHALKIASIAAAHEQAKAHLAAAHADRLKAMADDAREQLVRFSGRIDSLQELRVTDTRDTSEKVMEYMTHFDRFAAKLEATIDVLLSVSRGGQR